MRTLPRTKTVRLAGIFGAALASLVATQGCALLAGVEDAELDPGVTGSGGGASTGASPTAASGSGATGSTSSTSTGDAGSTGSTGSGGASTSSSSGSTSTGAGGGGACPDAVDGMIEIGAGPFMMGCNVDVDVECDADESPYHEVTVGCFLIDRFEVSRADYFACVQDGTCTEPEDDWDASGTALQDHPVTFVTHPMAVAYCNWVGKRLPTEAEWEKAARGDEGLKYPFGNQWGDGTPGGGDCTQANANLCRKDTWPIDEGATGVSPYGVFNMGGNVAEWVGDWYSDSYYAQSPAEDPLGPESGAVKSLRGGSWNSAVFDFRASARAAAVPDVLTGDLGYEVGVRCAK